MASFSGKARAWALPAVLLGASVHCAFVGKPFFLIIMLLAVWAGHRVYNHWQLDRFVHGNRNVTPPLRAGQWRWRGAASGSDADAGDAGGGGVAGGGR